MRALIIKINYSGKHAINLFLFSSPCLSLAGRLAGPEAEEGEGGEKALARAKNKKEKKKKEKKTYFRKEEGRGRNSGSEELASTVRW